MRDTRGVRLALEAGFLLGVAAALAAANLRPAWIVLVMLLAWAIVTLLELAAWRERPHWSSGLPPRYYVPEERLPPRAPGVELPRFSAYPRPRPREPEAATWIATPQLRAEAFGWPAAGMDDIVAPSASQDPSQEPQTTVEELPDELLAAASAAFDDSRDAGWPVSPRSAEDPWGFDDMPAEPVDPASAFMPVVGPPAAQVAASSVSARHHLDPFAEQAARRRPWQRTPGDEEGVVELRELPRHRPIGQRPQAGQDA